MTAQQSEFEQKAAPIRAAYLRPRGERPASTARGLHHMALICSDVERTIQFYQGVLGFPLIELMENRDYKGSSHLFFDIGNDNLLAFFDFPGLGLAPIIETIGAVQHIAISVAPEPFETLKAKLEEQEIPYIGPDRGADNSLYFKDPDGIQIELIREPLVVMEGRPLGE
ncbi:MAG: VOC family protein [Chloroflexi bacterium]|nr:VOC family protein [Chloroflexota bacterium]